MKNVRIIISGKVQGVLFRQSARDRAHRLGLEASAENCEDGSVCILAQGEDEAVDQFISWCKQGPPAATVRDVTVVQM